MSLSGLVWTAPAGQGFFGFQLAVGCKSCVRPVCAVPMCGRRPRHHACRWLQASGRTTSTAADQAHQHNVIVTSAQERLLALDTFLHEAKGAIERQRPLIERDDPQIKLVKIERLESITGDKGERLLGKPFAMSVALAD